MSELTLIGLHDDGEHVVLEGPDGQRFRLPIDEALRAAVRRDRPQLEQVRAELTGTVPPREIQARIRAGATAEDVAETSGMRVELVRRYEGPVLAEREYVAQQARATRIGHEGDSPVLGDLVTDRLATRGVAADSVRWDAFRRGGAPWTVEVVFTVGDVERSARWTYDAPTRSVRADDDEARWLSETELADEPIPRRHLAAVRTAYDVDVDAALRPLLASVDVPPEPEIAEPDPTEALLDDLSDRRGVRQHLEIDLDADDDGQEFEGFGPQHAFDFENPEVTTSDPGPVPAAHPPASRPDQAVDATVLEMPADYRERRRAGGARAGGAGPDAGSPAATPAAGDRPPTASEDREGATRDPVAHATEGAGGAGQGEDVPPPLAARRGRKGRASVPSWDEIVFGAKPE